MSVFMRLAANVAELLTLKRSRWSCVRKIHDTSRIGAGKMPRRSKGLLIEKSRSAIVTPLVIAAAASSVAACSDYKPETDTFSSVQADWSCLRGVAGEPANTPGAPGEDIFYSLRLVDLATNQPMVGVMVRACGLQDIPCNRPLTQSPLTTDADGFVRLTLTENFEGFLEISTPTAVPYLFQLPLGGLRTMTDFPLAMIAIDGFSAFLKAFDLEGESDEPMASIGVRAFDCRGSPAPGVQLKSTAGGTPWYFEERLPSLERTSTNKDGLGGFIGSTPGVSTLDAELPDGRLISRMSIIVRPGWMTAGYLKANPAQP